MTHAWDASRVSTLLFAAFAPHLLSPASKTKSPSGQPLTPAVDVIVTFDPQGISSHPNHISLYHGAHTFLAELLKRSPNSVVDLYVLTSVSILRKYLSTFDTVPTLISWAFSSDFKSKDRPASLVFFNQLVGEGGYISAWKAMTRCHVSQMKWFRYGWILSSRYMLMNDLRREKIKKGR